MSDELIRRQDVLDTLCKTCGGVGVNGCGVYGIDYPCDETVAVGKIPSVDAVEVVRCGDCKYSAEWSDKQFNCKWFNTLVFPNGFCSNGKGKSE